MAQKILGLDIGSHSIKAALFETAFRSFVLTDLFQSPPLMLDETHPEEHEMVIFESLQSLIEKNNLQSCNFVTSLSGKLVSSRTLTLPLPAKQIAKVLPFEIEGYTPFALDDLIIDHHVIDAKKNLTTVLAAAAQKTTIQEHLSILERLKIQPSFITFDSISLYNLNQFVSNGNFNTYAIIDIGHQKSAICIICKDNISFIRTIYIGGYDINEAIRTQLNLTLDQASDAKEKHGMLELDDHSVKSSDLRRLSNAIKTVMNPLFQEISQSLQLFRAQEWVAEEDQKIDQVFFCGGTSLLKNLPEYFTSLTDIPSQRMYLLDHQSPDRPSRFKEPVFATAVGIGLKVSGRGKNAAQIETINFRKAEFSFSKSLGDFQDKIMFFGKWILVIFVLAFLQLILKNNLLRSENNTIEKTALLQVKRIIPDDKSTTSKAAVKKLESKIQELQNKQDVLTSGLNSTTALGILRNLSTLIPADVPVDLKELSIERNKITIRGETDSFTSVDRVIASVQSNPDFQRVEKGDIRETPEGKKSFQMTVLVGPAEKENETPEKKKPVDKDKGTE